MFAMKIPKRLPSFSQFSSRGRRRCWVRGSVGSTFACGELGASTPAVPFRSERRRSEHCEQV